MNYYRVVITGIMDGEPYEHELLGDSEAEVRKRVKPMLHRTEVIKSVTFLRKYKN